MAHRYAFVTVTPTIMLSWNARRVGKLFPIASLKFKIETADYNSHKISLLSGINNQMVRLAQLSICDLDKDPVVSHLPNNKLSGKYIKTLAGDLGNASREPLTKKKLSCETLFAVYTTELMNWPTCGCLFVGLFHLHTRLEDKDNLSFLFQSGHD